MTNFTFESYIPKQDIKVRPTVLVDEIYKLIDIEIEDLSSEDITSKIKLKYINYLYKKIKKLLINYNFWKNVCSYDFCCYQYRNPKKDIDQNIGKICGRRIDKKKSYDSNSNKFFCSEHDRNHRKYHSKKIKIDENSRCYIILKNGSRCKYSCEKTGVCKKHIAAGKNNNHIYNVNINRKIQIIDKYYTNNSSSIKLISFYNEKEQNINKTSKNIIIEIEDNSFEDITSKKHKKYEKSKENIKNSGIKKCIKINENYDGNKILNKFHGKYIEIEYKKCDSKECNIIYSTYCTKHILNRPKKPIINIFKYKNSSPTTPTTFLNK